MSAAEVSVVIAAFDADRYLGETIESILAQTHPVSEIIVVDDGSSDRTVEVARSLGPLVTVLEGPHRGPAVARNEGVAASRFDLIALCDSDDLWLPRKIELQMELIDDTASPIAVFCGVDEFLSPELVSTSDGAREPRTNLHNVRMSSALLATRAAFEATGPFDPSTGVSDWSEWSIRMTSAVPDIRHLPEVLMRRRLHDRNFSLTPGRSAPAMPAALAAHLRRQREARG